jgi:hypothetical protein
MEERHGDIVMEPSNGKLKPRRFSSPVFHLLIVLMEICHCPFVDEETNESNPLAKRINGLAHLWLNLMRLSLAG